MLLLLKRMCLEPVLCKRSPCTTRKSNSCVQQLEKDLVQQGKPNKAKINTFFKGKKKKGGRDQFLASVKATQIAIPSVTTRGQQRFASSIWGTWQAPP